MRTAHLLAPGLLLLASLTTCPEAHAAPASAKAIEGEGCFRENGEGECKSIGKGVVMLAPSSFVGGKGGATLEFSDKISLRVPEGVEVKLLPRTKLQLSAKEDTSASVIGLNAGKVIVTLPEKGKAAMMVKAPHQMTSITKSGSAVVKVSDESMAVGAFSGSSLLASGNDWNDVPSGKLRVIKKSDPKGQLRPLMATPEVTQLKPVQLVMNDARGEPLKLTWQPVPGAERYEAELRPAAGDVARQIVDKTKNEAGFGSLGGGSYTLVVRAIDSEELEGPWSAPQRVQVASVELPKGAIVMGDGAIQLPDGQKVKLKNVAGLEASFNDFAMFVAPPSEVGLLAGRAQVLRLRRKGETEELRVRLEPRSVKAEVDLTPKTARWPTDPVIIEIRLVSGTGGAPPTDVQVVPTVTIDLAPVEVTWARDGGRYRGTVAPRNDAKPHTVRVEVADQHGFFLGRNFLEVAPAK